MERRKSGVAAFVAVRPPQKKSGWRADGGRSCRSDPPFIFSCGVLGACPPRRICIGSNSVRFIPNLFFSVSLRVTPACLPVSLRVAPFQRPRPFRRLPPLPSALLPSAAHLRRPPPPPTSAAHLRRLPPPPTSAAHLRRLPPQPSVTLRASSARRYAAAQPVHPPTVSAAITPTPTSIAIPPPPTSAAIRYASGGLSKAARRSAARQAAAHGRRGAAVWVQKKPPPSLTDRGG